MFRYLPTFRGFNTFYGLYNGKGDHFSHWDTENGMYGLDWHLDIGRYNRTNVVDEMGNYSTRAFSKRAAKLISEHDFESKPLFLYLPITAPHSAEKYDPVQVPRDAEELATVRFHFWAFEDISLKYRLLMKFSILQESFTF